MRSSPPDPLSLSLSLSLAGMNSAEGRSSRRPAGRRCGHGASPSLPHPVALCGRVERRHTAARLSLSLSLSLSLLLI